MKMSKDKIDIMAQTIKLFKLNSPKDISMVPDYDPTPDTFDKQEFERDINSFIPELIATEEDFLYIRNKSLELSKAVEKASLEGVREGVYKTLVDLLGFASKSIPDKFKYHMGNFITGLGKLIRNLDSDPVYNKLMEDPVVQRGLTTRHGKIDLEVRCSSISDTVWNCYGYHFNLKEIRSNLTEEEFIRLGF